VAALVVGWSVGGSSAGLPVAVAGRAASMNSDVKVCTCQTGQDTEVLLAADLS
jgi:hypothetical protein